MKAIPGLLQEHIEEAAFLALLREPASMAPNYTLAEIAELDERIEAHLAGVRFAGDEGWAACQEELSWQEPGEVFVATAIALAAPAPIERLEAVLAVARAGSPDEQLPLLATMGTALAWVGGAAVSTIRQRWAESADAAQRVVALHTCSRLRLDPGVPLHQFVPSAAALAGEDATLALACGAQAIALVGELGRGELSGLCEEALAADAVELRWAAARSLQLTAGVGAVRTGWREVLEQMALGDPSNAAAAAELLARALSPRDALEWHRHAADKDLRRGIDVARGSGDATLVPWLLDVQRVDELARPAAQAMSWITGIDFNTAPHEGEAPADFSSGPVEGPDDPALDVIDPDEDLPWPHRAAAGDWWSQNKGRFPKGQRLWLGQPESESGLRHALRMGGQQLRSAAATQLCLMDRAAPLYEVRKRAAEQLRELTSVE